MNNTGHGRWRRYKTIDGVLHKKCNGILHSDGGAWLPLRSFWTIKNGPRAGKPFSRCVECEKTARGRDPKASGLIAIVHVWWIFLEIRNRVGKAEACRLLGVSQNFWWRAERGVYYNIRRATARRAVEVLHELRENGTVRHRASIKHGAAMRGREEKKVVAMKDVYKRHGDIDAENHRRFING